MLNIKFENKQMDFKIEENLLVTFREITEVILELEGIDEICEVEVDLSFVGNEEIQALNSVHRKKDTITDVLSFPQYESLKDDEEIDDELYLGDVVINYEQAVLQAKEYGHSTKRELCYLYTHSILHLFGYDHDGDERTKEMREMEEWVLNKLEIGR